MKLKVDTSKDGSHADVATCVAWATADEVLSGGDDNKVLQWGLLTGDHKVCCKLPEDVFPTHMSHLPGQSKSEKQSLFVLTSADGKFHFFSKSGRIEKSIEAHRGAISCGKWSHDGNAFATAGEDGLIKVWSRSGMLRSTLVQSRVCIYSLAWSPEGDQVLYTSGKEVILKPLQPTGKSINWKAHDGVVLDVDWNPVTNLIISGGEDCKYKVWDSFGRALYSSISHDYPITSLAWANDGNLFAVGSFNSLRLCDKSGWCHGMERTKYGSIMKIAWSNDGTQVAAACFDGNIVFAHCIEKSLEWREFEANQVSRKTIKVRNVLNDATDTLEMKDRVIKVSLDFHYLIIITSTQCHVYSTNNFNTPCIIELRQSAVSFIIQAEKHFLLSMVSGIYIYSYEGRQLSSPRVPGSNSSALLSYRCVSLSNDVLAVKTGKDDHAVALFDAVSGKPLYEGSLVVHNAEVVDVHLSFCGSLSERYLAVIDKNQDVFLTAVSKVSSKFNTFKLASMIQSLKWNQTVNMLCGLSDSSVLVWFYPPVVFVDQGVLPITLYQKEHNELGKNPLISSYIENMLNVFREDGSLMSLSITPYPTVLHRLVTSGKWNEAVRLCRFAKDKTLWACLAAMSLKKKDLDTAEIAYASVEEADKVECINEIKRAPSKDVRAAEMSLFCGQVAEPEAAFLHAGKVYHAIQLNLELFRWERAIDIALKHKTHVDTVLWFRKLYLEKMGRSENNQKFKKFSKGVELNWDDIKAKIEQDLTS